MFVQHASLNVIRGFPFKIFYEDNWHSQLLLRNGRGTVTICSTFHSLGSVTTGIRTYDLPCERRTSYTNLPALRLVQLLIKFSKSIQRSNFVLTFHSLNSLLSFKKNNIFLSLIFIFLKSYHYLNLNGYAVTSIAYIFCIVYLNPRRGVIICHLSFFKHTLQKYYINTYTFFNDKTISFFI